MSTGGQEPETTEPAPPSLTLIDAAAALREGTITSVGLTAYLLSRADAYDPQLGAYLARFDESALAAAAQADEQLRAGDPVSLLHGIPLGVKDIIATREGPTTAQSRAMASDHPVWGTGRDAVVVARLRAAGAVITGKLTTMEYACGMPDFDGPFPIPRNPWNPEHWSGGSSSGTGVAVAAGLVLGGLGSDTGGSIRCPAAFCGVTGLMPTYGRVPRSGIVPLAYTLDHVGPLARSARDCAALLEVLAGSDPTDPATVARPAPGYLDALTGDLSGLRIGVVSLARLSVSSAAAVGPTYEAALDVLRLRGAELRDVALPHFAAGTTAAMLTLSAEALTYHRSRLGTHWSSYTRSLRQLVAQGALCSAADYVQAQRVRQAVQLELAELFRDVDLIVLPTCSTVAPRYADLLDDPAAIDDLYAGLYTSYWDGVGNPVLALPIGFGHGLPLSLQIAGRPFEEATVVRAGDAYQQETDWHLRMPRLVVGTR